MFRQLRQRLRQVLRRRQIERELEEEIQSHLAMKQQEKLDSGLPPEEAYFAARRAFGNGLQAREESHAAWEFGSLETWWRDIRYGIRLLRRSPGFTCTAVLALALGIGANAGIFSVVNAVLFRPLPYADPSRLVVALHFGTRPVAPANYLDWRAQSRSYTDMAAAQMWAPTLTGTDRPAVVESLQVSANLFSLLGVQPLLGRGFVSREDQPGAQPVVVLSYGLWQKQFGGDRDILGRALTLDGKTYTVVGVMPSFFQFPPFWATGTQLWSPLVLGPRAHDRTAQSLRIFARLRTGVPLAQAQAEMDTIMGRLERQYPRENARLDAKIVPLHERVVSNIRPLLWVLLGAVAFVLLAACANVGNLLLARAASRQKEMAMRVALGAGRGRLLRQLLTESAVLSVLGGALGLLLAYSAVQLLSAALPPGALPRQQEVTVDGQTLFFCAALSLLTSLMAGAVPAWQLARTDQNEVLKSGGRTVSGGRRQNRTRRFLVAAEVAMALLLLMGAGVMLRSFVRLLAVDPGFNPQRLLTLSVSVAGSRQSDPARRNAFYEELTQRLRALPGVELVSAVNHLPIAGDSWRTRLVVQGQPVPEAGTEPEALYRVVRPQYFAAMQIPLRAGRDFLPEDRAGSPRVVIVNEVLARRLWPGESPLGKHIRTGSALSLQTQDQQWLTVVGVVKDVKQTDWSAPAESELYLPFAQQQDYLTNPAPHYSYLTFVVRTAGDPLAAAGAVQAEVWALDRNLPVRDVQTMTQVVANDLWRTRVSLWLLGVFAAVALTLAATGIYGVISHAVTERTHEVGIRLALGANRPQILWLTFRDGLPPVLAGLLIGSMLSILTTKSMNKLLFEVTPHDPLTCTAVVILLLVVAVTANYLPARRAVRTDPIRALRHE